MNGKERTEEGEGVNGRGGGGWFALVCWLAESACQKKKNLPLTEGMIHRGGREREGEGGLKEKEKNGTDKEGEREATVAAEKRRR